MSDGLFFLILVLAVHRGTHLVVEDQLPLVRRPRDWLVARKPEGPLAYLVNCFWCSSVWVSAVAVGLLYVWTPSGWDGVPAPLALGAALSTGAAFVETVLEYWDARIIGGGS
jgi:hypothetical protein